MNQQQSQNITAQRGETSDSSFPAPSQMLHPPTDLQTSAEFDFETGSPAPSRVLVSSRSRKRSRGSRAARTDLETCLPLSAGDGPTCCDSMTLLRALASSAAAAETPSASLPRQEREKQCQAKLLRPRCPGVFAEGQAGCRYCIIAATATQ